MSANLHNGHKRDITKKKGNLVYSLIKIFTTKLICKLISEEYEATAISAN